MLNTRFAPWPKFEEDEIAAVSAVLRSGKVNYWTGEITKRFESEYARYHGRRYGLALANGTLALELALLGYGIGEGDEVITTSRTFIASASCIVRVGATPVIADVDLQSQNITAETIRAVLTPKTKAIVVVHLAGWPAPMPEIMELAKQNGLIVIEDCAQAHGAKINDRYVGSFGHAAAFSFCQDKIISTGGEGGLVLLDDEQIYKKMWAFKDHGKDFDAVYNRSHPPGFRWLHESFGTNWRFTEPQSAIGEIQLRKLAGWVESRREIANQIYHELKDEKAIRIPLPPAHIYHSYYRFYAFLNFDQLKPGITRDQIMIEISERGVPCFVGSCGEIYKEQAFIQAGLAPKNRLPNSAILSDSSLAFLVHPGLDKKYVHELSQAVKSVLARYQK